MELRKLLLAIKDEGDFDKVALESAVVDDVDVLYNFNISITAVKGSLYAKSYYDSIDEIDPKIVAENFEYEINRRLDGNT